MSRRRGFLLCAFPALSTVLLASDGKALATPEGSPATDHAGEPGVPALFSWTDYDGDGRLDLAAVSADGALQLLRNANAGRFEDVTQAAGLSEVRNAGLALWADYDGDGRLDLFVGAREDRSRLFRNEGGVFVDMSAGSGLESAGAVQSAHWLDHDGDGRLDLHVVTAEKNQVFRGLEGGFFELAELPLAGAASASVLDGILVDENGLGTPSIPGPSSEIDRTRAGGSIGVRERVDGVNVSGGPIALGPAPTVTDVTPIDPFPTGCVNSIRDQGNLPGNLGFTAAGATGKCITASSTPTLGRLYPISEDLFVAISGDVGIGTTSPAAKLEVAGTARMSGFELPTGAAAGQVLTSDASGEGTWQSVAVADQWVDETGDTMTGTLILNPGDDQALDISTGSIYKGGALFIHTKGSDQYSGNTALGQDALAGITTGIRNTASGYHALSSNTAGFGNTACGTVALTMNTYGENNSAVGNHALYYNTTGSANIAIGSYALYPNTTGSFNTAIGHLALVSNTTGSGNIAIGAHAGGDLMTGNENIVIGNSGVIGDSATIRLGTGGTHTRTFVAGIRGVTTGVADAIPVLVDSTGQLGTVSSSRRFKTDIADMGDATERLIELRPVIFRYKQEQEVPSGEVPLEYGLIAEEVAEIFPDLVVYDEEGLPFTVKYHLLSSMLLNELKKQAGELDELRSELEEQGTRLAALEARASSVGLPVASPADSR